jgi:hypothetical protein
LSPVEAISKNHRCLSRLFDMWGQASAYAHDLVVSTYRLPNGNLTVHLKPQNETAFEKTVDALYDPGSPTIIIGSPTTI